jgi:hypothetical protein
MNEKVTLLKTKHFISSDLGVDYYLDFIVIYDSNLEDYTDFGQYYPNNTEGRYLQIVYLSERRVFDSPSSTPNIYKTIPHTKVIDNTNLNRIVRNLCADGYKVIENID